jgi:hypothetical protein
MSTFACSKYVGVHDVSEVISSPFLSCQERAEQPISPLVTCFNNVVPRLGMHAQKILAVEYYINKLQSVQCAHSCV